MTDEVMVEESSTQRVYEAGYLMLPSISEQQISEEVNKLKTAITHLSGSVIAEGSPELRTLAYEMEKMVGTKNERFGSAYFGWVKFEMAPVGVLSFKTDLDANPKILRFILIKTARNAHLPPKPREVGVKGEAGDAATVALPNLVASQDDIDKSIDELVRE
jgi:ribosomal protein S6